MTVGIPEGVAERIGKLVIDEMVRAGEMARNGLRHEVEQLHEVVIKIVDIHKVEVKIRKGDLPAIAHDVNLQRVAAIPHPSQRYLDFATRKANLEAFYRKSPMLEHEFKARVHAMANEAAHDLFPLTDLKEYTNRRDWLKYLMNHSPMTDTEFTAFGNRLKQEAVDGIFANPKMSYDSKRGWLKYVFDNSPMTAGEHQTLSRRLMEQAMAGNGVR